MLSEIIKKNHYIFIDEAKDWKDAIKLSCEPLIEDKTIDERYITQIIECVEEYGPYIVLIPGVAMPHSQKNAEGVFDTAVSFMKLKKPVSFDENDPDKDAILFFTIASVDSDKHLENLTKLSDMLVNEELLEELFKVEDVSQLEEIAKKYSL